MLLLTERYKMQTMELSSRNHISSLIPHMCQPPQVSSGILHKCISLCPHIAYKLVDKRMAGGAKSIRGALVYFGKIREGGDPEGQTSEQRT